MFPYGKACYDHIGGELGAFLWTRAAAVGLLDVKARPEPVLGKDGKALLGALGIDAGQLATTKRKLVNGCTDRATMKEHLGSFVGYLVRQRLEELGWLKEVHGELALDPPRLVPEAWRKLFDVTAKPGGKTP